MATQRYLSATNVHLPIPTGVVVGYLQDASKFPYRDYVQTVESPAKTGTYKTLNRDHPVRIISEADYVWARGSRAPQNHMKTGPFKDTEFMLDRVTEGFELDDDTAEMARKHGKWDPVEYEAKVAANKLAILRVMRIWLGGADSPNGLNLDSSSTWGTGSSQSAATLSGVLGGTWENAQPSSPVIEPSIMEAARRINMATNGVVQPADLILVINPIAAIKIKKSQEIRDFIKQQASSPELLTKNFNKNKLWGLPDSLYGFELRVEWTQRANGPMTETATDIARSYVKNSTTACLLARPGGISAPYGAKSFSTVQLLWHKYDMAVEMHAPENGWHKMHEGRVVDDRTIISPAIESGFQISGILD